MISLFINALAASAGGGLTYVRNVVPQFSFREDLSLTVLVSAALRTELPVSPNVRFITPNAPVSAAARFLFEQRRLPQLIRQSGADILLSPGNFALWNSPVPQILLSRNALYTSQDFSKDLRTRSEYKLFIGTQIQRLLAQASVHCADRVVAPSEAFARDLRCWTGKDAVAIPHGFDCESFTRHSLPLPDSIQQKLDGNASALRLLFVSHYNYYRNFETLFRALPILKQKLNPRPLRLFLTCKLTPDGRDGEYRTGPAAALLRDLNLSREVVELGPVPYHKLHHLYKAAHIYVSPAYAETFAHPLVEAMYSGLPIVASELPVHREVCAGAALYFDRFSPEDLSERIAELATSPDLADELRQTGTKRSRTFSWKEHVANIVTLAQSLISAKVRSESPRLRQARV